MNQVHTEKEKSKERNAKTRSSCFWPVFVILIGAGSALLFSKFMEEWAFIPLALIYWSIIFFISFKQLGKNGIIDLFKKPNGKKRYLVFAIIVGLIPLSIFLMNLKLLTNLLAVILWIVFAFVNPFFEEIFWRGYLLQKLPFPNTINYYVSTIFFVASHPLMWGIFSIANRSWMTLVSLAIMGVVWSIIFTKTNSLRWCYVSHIMVDIFNLSVFVFLNLYIPPFMS